MSLTPAAVSTPVVDWEGREPDTAADADDRASQYRISHYAEQASALFLGLPEAG